MRNSLTRLRRLYRNRPEHGDFTWWHDVGSLVAELIPKGKHYGENAIELVVQYLEPDRKPTDVPRYFLYKTRDLAAKFSREEASELTEARLKNGKPLTENHVKALLSIKKLSQRKRLQKKCLEHSWSIRRLRDEIHYAEGRKRGGAGRKPKPLKRQFAGVALPNISVMAGNWLRNHAVWFKGASRPFRTVRKKDCDQAILDDAVSAIEKLEEMHEAITDGLHQLNSFVRELKEEVST